MIERIVSIVHGQLSVWSCWNYWVNIFKHTYVHTRAEHVYNYAMESIFISWRHHDLALHWRHNDRDGVSSHQPHGCLLNHLFRRRSKKTSKLHVTGLCVWGIHRDRWIPRTKGQLRGKCFHLMTSSWVVWYVRYHLYIKQARLNTTVRLADVVVTFTVYTHQANVMEHQPWWRHDMETLSA